jgi:protocatechuate 3,4-dioxygenase beta subunit
VVNDADGHPFAGVEVTISGGAGSRALSTDKTGTAEIAGIPPGSYAVLVRPPGAPGLRSARSAEVAPGERLEVRCQVPAFDAQIAGRILDTSGQPVKGIVVEARPITFPGAVLKFESIEPPSPSQASGPDGAFQIDGLARVEHALTTRETPRYPPARAVAVAGSAEPVDITVGERRSLAVVGTVIDPDGAVVSGVQVSVLTHPAAPATTDPEGRFRVEVKYERGAVAFAAKKQGYAQGEAVVTAAEIGDQEEVEMALVIEPLGKTGELRGRIADPQGKPIAKQVVRIHSSSLNGNYQGVSGDNGEYSIREIRIAPDYQASVSPDRDWTDFAEGPFEIPEGSTRLDIVLEPLSTGRLTGKMVDPDGRPVPRLTLWVRSLTATSNVSTITGDDQGRFTLEDAPAGDLRFETRATPLISAQGIRLEAGESHEVEILVGLGAGRLDGQVTGPDGKTAVAGARLTLSWNGTRGTIQSTVYREVSSDAQGRFSFSGLSKGRGSIIASAPGYQDFRETRELTGEAEELQIPLNVAPK